MNKIEELQAEIKALQQQAYDERTANEKARNEMLTELKAKVVYDYTCKHIPEPSHFHRVPRAIDYLYINRVVNPECLADINKALEDAGHYPAYDSDFFTGGMAYYLSSDGIIHSYSGGVCILDTPQICSQEEWEELKNGIIPTKLQRT